MTVREWLNASVEYYKKEADKDIALVYNVKFNIANTFLFVLHMLPAAALDMELEDGNAE